jgi:hypothetical protein
MLVTLTQDESINAAIGASNNGRIDFFMFFYFFGLIFGKYIHFLTFSNFLDCGFFIQYSNSNKGEQWLRRNAQSIYRIDE